VGPNESQWRFQPVHYQKAQYCKLLAGADVVGTQSDISGDTEAHEQVENEDDGDPSDRLIKPCAANALRSEMSHCQCQCSGGKCDVTHVERQSEEVADHGPFATAAARCWVRRKGRLPMLPRGLSGSMGRSTRFHCPTEPPPCQVCCLAKPVARFRISICEPSWRDVYNGPLIKPLWKGIAMMKRREFLRQTALTAGGLYLFGSPNSALGAATGAPCRIEVLLGEELGAISSNIYSHFTENLSGVIYDGIWVGKNSKVPNIGGIRSELVEHMRKIKPAVIRFPGGCFADSYDWRDGVGPAEKRPRRTNFWDGAEGPHSPANHRYDPNQFGTDEFIRFCRLTGGQPYLAANVRGLPAEEFDRWVEYCNSPAGSTTLADMRAAGGSPEPFDVRYWGVGNESWGCGGNFLPHEYAMEFRRYAAWVPGYGKPLSLIASGPNSDDLDWTRGFFEGLARKGKEQINSVYGFALHHYAWNLARGKTQDWDQGKGDARKFEAVDWYELLREGQKVQDLIDGH